MNSRCRLITFLILVLGILVGRPSYGQSDSAVVRQQFDSLKSEAWSKVNPALKGGAREKADSLQRIYTEKFYRFFKAHKGSYAGGLALDNAFIMWSNIEGWNQILDAASEVERDRKIWRRLLLWVRQAYNIKGQSEDFLSLLHVLEDSVTDRETQATVLRNLAEYYKKAGQKKQAESYYRKVLSLSEEGFNRHEAKKYLYGADSVEVGPDSLAPGMSAPSFAAKTIEHDSISLDQLEGRVVLLDFWGTWCGPCIEELPHLKRVYDQYRDQDFQLIGLAHNENAEKVRTFTDKRDINWPQILQPGMSYSHISKLYNIQALPSTILIDRNGNIAAMDLRGREIEKTVSRLMNR